MQFLAPQSRCLSLQLLLLPNAHLQKPRHVGVVPLNSESHTAASRPATCPRQPASLPAVFTVQVSAETDHISQAYFILLKAHVRERNDNIFLYWDKETATEQ